MPKSQTPLRALLQATTLSVLRTTVPCLISTTLSAMLRPVFATNNSPHFTVCGLRLALLWPNHVCCIFDPLLYPPNQCDLGCWANPVWPRRVTELGTHPVNHWHQAPSRKQPSDHAREKGEGRIEA
ncbi:uncharacterized protein BDZ83DRAFT_196219 [Colletotrichum acutatum]|uniref:Uncharacterized protein n=1 Tax=Glomerella acutata TaxID=27357 RepID=A0AAD8XJA6_GLOAC|nr:uncharacterized protein BDZ83DRAFT_196219 [Colletotrichum acutatum]KAK1727588.1 hypothetical protein BDZ83DRAFT_196219 [Colletotrichum acutatum]